MATIDERITSMVFDNKKFEAGVATTLATLAKLNASLASVGKINGLSSLESIANKVTLNGPMSALDKLKSKLSFGKEAADGFNAIDTAGKKVKLDGPMSALDRFKQGLSGLGSAASAGFSFVERAGSKLAFLNPFRAIDAVRSKLFGLGAGAAESFSEIEQASGRMGLVGVNRTIDRTEGNLASLGATTAFADIEKQANGIDLSGMTKAIDGVSNQFSVLEGAASVALGNIASQAFAKVKQASGGFTLDPIKQGFEEYETNIKSIQTILANTEAQGTKLKDVNKALAELNRYSDKTIYNFAQMADNIGKFTAAGVDLDTATSSIKGIANLAAISGASAEKLAPLMTQLSQAVASGRFSLMDYSSVQTAGVGGAIFQKAIINTALALGTLEKSMVDIDKKTGKMKIAGKSFREAISGDSGIKPFINEEVLTTTFSTLTGDMKDAELAAKGFSKEQIKAIQQTAKSAVDAATKVKTLSALLDTTKEQLASGYGKSFQLILGDYSQAKKTFTAFSDAIGAVISRTANARNKILQDFVDLGGRKDLLAGLKAAIAAAASLFEPIRDAFRDIFPRKTGEDLAAMAESFRKFMEELKIGDGTAEKIRRTFRGFFSILSIGKTVVGNVFGIITDLLDTLFENSGGFLAFTASIGDFLTELDKAIKSGKGFTDIFDVLPDILKRPLDLLKKIAGTILGLFTGDGIGGAGDTFLDTIKNLITQFPFLDEVIDAVIGTWRSLIRIFKGTIRIVDAVAQTIADGIENLSDLIVNAVKGIDSGEVIDALEAGLLGAIAFYIKKGLGDLTEIIGENGLLGELNHLLGGLTGTLTAMQRNLQADTLLKIGLAILALAGGVFILASIDPKRLTGAMGAVAVGIGQLVGAMALLTRLPMFGGTSGGKGGLYGALIGSITGGINTAAMAAGLIAIATALFLLTGSILILSRLDWEELAKGLIGVGGALAAVGGGLKFMGPSIIFIGPALIPVAFAMGLLAAAVGLMGSYDLATLAKGILGINTALVALGGGLKHVGPYMLVTGPGLIAVSIGLGLLAGAVGFLGQMDLATLVKGILGMNAALVVLGGSLVKLPPPNYLIAQGGALVLVGFALSEIAVAMRIMGGMSLVGIAKSLIAMGGALIILSRGLFAMMATRLGAAALLGAAVAFSLLGPALAFMGNLDVLTIVKGLLAMAAVLGVLGLAGLYLAAPLTAVGLAMLAFGGAALLISGAVFLFAAALAQLGEAGPKAVTALLLAMTAFITFLPKFIVELVKAIITLGVEMAKAAPQIVESMTKLARALLEGIIDLTPDVVRAISSLLSGLIQIIYEHTRPLIDAGLHILFSLLEGISQNISKITHTVADIITRFFTALNEERPRLLASGFRVLVGFLDGIRKHLGEVVTAAFDVVNKFLTTVASNIPEFIKSGGAIIVKFLKGLADQLPRMIRAGGRVIEGFLEGVRDSIPGIVIKAHETIRAFLKALGDREQIRKTVAQGLDTAINFIDGITLALRESKFIKRLIDAAYDLGKEIAKGILDGLRSLADDIQETILGFSVTKDYDKADAEANAEFDREMEAIAKKRNARLAEESAAGGKDVGRNLGEGTLKGISEKAPDVERAARKVVQGAIDGAKKQGEIRSPSRKFMEIGRQLVAGMEIGLLGFAVTLKRRITEPMAAMIAEVGRGDKLSKFLDGKFTKGLSGTKDDIRESFSGLKDQIKKSMEALEKETKTASDNYGKAADANQKRIRDAAKKVKETHKEWVKAYESGDAKASIKAQEKYNKAVAAQAALPDTSSALNALFRSVIAKEKFLEQSKKASEKFFTQLTDEKSKLFGLAKAYENVAQQLEDAQGALDTIKSDKASFVESLTEQYSDLPDISSLMDAAMADADLTWAERMEKRRQAEKEAEKRRQIDQVANYKKALEEQIKATQKYHETLEKLRALKLDDATYRKLLEDGVQDQDFATQLLASGKAGIEQINKLDAELLASSTKLANESAAHMYDAGIKTAQGLVDGLKLYQGAIKALMEQFGNDMVEAIKKKLKIRSPSQIFAEIGRYSVEGMAKGLTDSASLVSTAAGQVGDEAISAMQDSINKVSDILAADINDTMTITPVLDLTQVEKDAGRLSDLTNVTPITAAASYGQAAAISEEQAALLQAQSEAAAANTGPTLIFEQNNMSPDKLSEIEIYRQTSNQLAQAKSILGVASS